MTIGILAYGSLIEDPGIEINPLIVKRIKDVKTPFKIEFARTSKSRDGAPTLVQYKKGSVVYGQVLVLKDNISLNEAKNLLWRRETRKEGTGKVYTEEQNPSKNKVIVEIEENFSGLDMVIYTKIGSNIEDVTADKLAELAINSAKAEAGKNCKDGISYLISVKRQGITTPLMKVYEKAILATANTTTLESAYNKILNESV